MFYKQNIYGFWHGFFFLNQLDADFVLCTFGAINLFIMKEIRLKQVCGTTLLSGLLLLSACHSSYELVGTEGKRVQINSGYDANPDADAVAILAPYKAEVDSIMTPVIGKSEMAMAPGRPESLLSNLVADVLRQYANSLPGQMVEVAMTNVGGLRSDLPAGDITYGNVYEVLPFQNTLCIVTLTGKDVKQLFSEIARVGGEGISNAQLVITKEGKLVSATVGGKEIKDDTLYKVATLDYLAEGNDGMTAFLNAKDKECPEGATIRQIFLDYVAAQTKKGKALTSKLDGRITIQ